MLYDDLFRHVQNAPFARSMPTRKWPKGSFYTVDDVAHLEELYEATMRIAPQYGFSIKDGITAEVIEQHELQHFVAASKAAFSTSQSLTYLVGVLVVRHRGSAAKRLGREASFQSTADFKGLDGLPLASAAGYPDEPSDVDLALARRLGYPNVNRLAMQFVNTTASQIFLVRWRSLVRTVVNCTNVHPASVAKNTTPCPPHMMRGVLCVFCARQILQGEIFS